MSQTSNLKPFGRHRTKISPFQTPSEETLAYAESIKDQILGPGDLAYAEWAALGLTLPRFAGDAALSLRADSGETASI